MNTMDNATPYSQTHWRSEGDINTTAARQAWLADKDDHATADLLQRDAAVFLHQAMSTPCLDGLSTAQGCYLYDLSGQRYLDFHGNNVHQLGHGHPHVVAKVTEQMHALPFAPRRFTHETAVRCAEKLTDIAGGELKRVLFAPGGTSVIGMALKLARHVTQNFKVVSLWDAFHGASLDAISVGGEACFRQGMGPLMAGVERIPPAITYRGAFPHPEGSDVHYADYLEYVIEKEGGIGAFIAEAVRNTDVQVPSRAYWQRVREICDKHNVLLIIDDIPNGMGRSGEWFTHQAFGIEPDILCIGKGLGAGLVPIAALLTKEKYNTAAQVSLGHYTHEKSPLGCAAALACIEVIEQQNLLSKVQADSAYMQQRLNQMQQQFSLIGDVRGIGLLWGIELVTDRTTKQRAFDEAEAVLYHCLQHGLSFKVSQGNVLQLSPPLIITRQELDHALDILHSALLAVSQQSRHSHQGIVMNSPIQAVIFDWAGTIIDFGSFAPTSIFVEAFQQGFHFEISLAEAREPMGLGKWQHIEAVGKLPSVAQRWQQQFGRPMNASDIDAIYAAFMPLQIAKVADHAAPIPHALEVVDQIRSRGIKIGSCTGYPRQVMDVLIPVAADYGYRPDHIVATDDLAQGGRPAPFMALQNVIELGVTNVRACVKVDDALPGIEEGHNAGMWTVGLLLSGNEAGLTLEEYQQADAATLQAARERAKAKLQLGKPHYLIDTIADLPAVLLDIERRLLAGEQP